MKSYKTKKMVCIILFLIIILNYVSVSAAETASSTPSKTELSDEEINKIMNKYDLGTKELGSDSITSMMPMLMGSGGDYEQILQGLVLQSAAQVKVGTCGTLGDYASLFIGDKCMSSASTALFKILELTAIGTCNTCTTGCKAGCAGAAYGTAACIKLCYEGCGTAYTAQMAEYGKIANMYRLVKIMGQDFEEATCSELGSSCIPVTDKVGGFIRYGAMAKCGNMMGIMQGVISGDFFKLFKSSMEKGILNQQTDAEKELLNYAKGNPSEAATLIQNMNSNTIRAMSPQTVAELKSIEINGGGNTIFGSQTRHFTSAQNGAINAKDSGSSLYSAPAASSAAAAPGQTPAQDTTPTKQQPKTDIISSFASSLTSSLTSPQILQQIMQAKMQQDQQRGQVEQGPTDYSLNIVAQNLPRDYTKGTENQKKAAEDKANEIAGNTVAQTSATAAAVTDIDEDIDVGTLIYVDTTEFYTKGVKYVHPNRACFYSMNFHKKEIDLLQFYDIGPAAIHTIEPGKDTNMYIVEGDNNCGLENKDGITYQLDKDGRTEILSTYPDGALVEDEYGNTIWTAPGDTVYSDNLFETNTNIAFGDSGIVVMPTQPVQQQNTMTGNAVMKDDSFYNINIQLDDPLPRPNKNSIGIFVDSKKDVMLSTRNVNAKIDLSGDIKVFPLEIKDEAPYGTSDIAQFKKVKVGRQYHLRSNNEEFNIIPDADSTNVYDINKKQIQDSDDKDINKDSLSDYQKNMLDSLKNNP